MFHILRNSLKVCPVFRLGVPCQVLRRCFADQSRVICEMSKVYFRLGEGEFHVTFQFNEPDIGISKQCNMCRKLTETVEHFLQRVNCNVDKLVQKKFRKVIKQGGTAPVVNSDLLWNGSSVARDVVCEQFFEDKFSDGMILEVMNGRYDVVINSPWVESLLLSDKIMAGFPAYPAKFEGYCLDKELCEFQWFKCKTNNGEWLKCGEGFYHETDVNHIGCFLKLQCTPKHKNKQGPAYETVTSTTVEAGPGVCPFETRHLITANRCEENVVRVVSYNILADLYAETIESKTILFPYCPPYALTIGYRKQLLLKEIMGYNADLLCLQEVDGKVFRNDLVPMLARQSLEGQYSEKGGTVSEGTAIFYNTNKFELISCDQILPGEEIDKNPIFQELWEKVKNNVEFCARFQCRTTVVQAVGLNCKENPNEVVLVGNTHLYFHPDADNVRLMQGITAFIYLMDQKKRLQEMFPDKNVSLVLCGDFNSVPECGIYQFLTTGSVSAEHVDWRSNKSEVVENVSFSHPLKIASACGTPQYTNYTAGFKDCLDYIYYETDRLSVEQVVPFPSNEELSAHIAIPSIVFPSDHIALIADVKWNMPGS